jgi:hypothetical protein
MLKMKRSEIIKMKNGKILRGKKKYRHKMLMRNRVEMMMHWHTSLVLKA